MVRAVLPNAHDPSKRIVVRRIAGSVGEAGSGRSESATAPTKAIPPTGSSNNPEIYARA
jgi:ABC-type dipeptide/oligopeptide/nickel transport system ATPase component